MAPTTTDAPPSTTDGFTDDFNAVLRARLAERRARFEAALATAGMPAPSKFGLRVDCPLCKAKAGTDCVKRTGTGAAPTHQVRLRKNGAVQHARTSKLVMLVDDPDFGLNAGDVLLAHPYPYDSKWTILARESDGFDPQCNQYSDAVAWVAWA